MKFPRLLTLATALLFLGSCDEDPTVITHVDRLPDLVLKDIWKIQDDRGIPVEVHGSPFHRTTDARIVGALKVPADAPQDVRFYVIPGGGAETGHPWRLVLHFNPQGPPNAVRDCSLTEEARTNPLPDKGFSMNLVFCQGKLWKAHGFMTVMDITDGDYEAFTRHFQTLFSVIFRNEKGD